MLSSPDGLRGQPVDPPRGRPPDPSPSPLARSEARDRHADEPDLTDEVLKRVSDMAFEHPPKDLLRLSASASKFLLTNLEPALRLAREVREHAEREDRPERTVRIAADDRRREALSVLSERPSRRARPTDESA